MSRGAGQVMRAALEALSRLELADTLTVTGAVFGTATVSAAQASSVRRALRGLAQEGRAIDLGRGFQDGRRRWATPERAAAYLRRAQVVSGH